MNARVAIYARVSTTNHGQDVSLQTRELRQFAEARGWKLADEYVDAGVSGSKDSRPELNRLMADAKRRRFDVVLVWKLDRFGRSLRHLVNALAEFESLGIAFVSLSDNLDLSTASGRLMFNIIGAMAEFERELIRERVKAGMKNAKAKGARIGRPRVAVDAVRISHLRAEGRSIYARSPRRWDIPEALSIKPLRIGAPATLQLQPFRGAVFASLKELILLKKAASGPIFLERREAVVLRERSGGALTNDGTNTTD
jgi:DNA invertase Pin-like site-specific DNA recombinase